MMRHQTLEHRFGRNVPRELDPGVLYISMDYATAVHSCCCGCGDRVVTPFTPTDWLMTFDGESVSLSPSVGNWNQVCRSHYIIQRNRVIECGNWSDARVEAERGREKRAKSEYYGHVQTRARVDSPPPTLAGNIAQTRGLWARFLAWFSS